MHAYSFLRNDPKNHPEGRTLPLEKSNDCVRASPLKPDNGKNEKLKFSIFAVSENRASVYEWRPHHKNSKTFPPWLQAPIKILSEKNRAKRRPDFCFSNEKRGSVHYWKIITNLLGWKIKKRHLKRGQKWGFLRGFSLYLLLRDISDLWNGVLALAVYGFEGVLQVSWFSKKARKVWGATQQTKQSFSMSQSCHNSDLESIF